MGSSLIDKAIKVCGSQAEVARRLNVSRVAVHEIQRGKKQMSPELAVLCAEIVGDDPYRAAALAMVENCKDQEKAERLTRAFHLPRLAGGVAMLLFFVVIGGGLISESKAGGVNQQLTVYTLLQVCVLLGMSWVYAQAQGLKWHLTKRLIRALRWPTTPSVSL